MGTHPIFESDFDCLTECREEEALVGEEEVEARDRTGDRTAQFVDSS